MRACIGISFVGSLSCRRTAVDSKEGNELIRNSPATDEQLGCNRCAQSYGPKLFASIVFISVFNATLFC